MKKYLKRLYKALLNKPQATYNAEKNYAIKTYEQELKGRVALVSGGTGCLGRAICSFLAAQGAIVYIGGRNEERMNSIADEIKAIGGTAHGILLDVSDQEVIKNAVHQISAKEKRLDIVVNCAGGSARSDAKDLIHQDKETILSVIDNNLMGTILLSKYAAVVMKEKNSGCIVNISSTTGIQGNVGNCDYTAAKSGVIGFTKALAQELGPYGIRVNCVSPGYIQTGEFDDKRVEYLERTNYLHRVGEPEDIAEAVQFLVTDRAKFITGINLVVDGGRILGLHTFNC